MTTYICKCGRTFQKNTEAGTTGFRMPDYGPEHECFGCPFVQKECWRENGQDVDAYACRGSKVLDYQTDAYCCDSKGAALHVRTLDLKFIQAFFKDYLTLPGHIEENFYHGMDSPENGRQQYSFGFAANKQGDADRKALIDHYFRSEGERPGALPSGCDRLVRKDVTPEQEKEIVLNQIKEAKALAQGKSTPAEVGTVYYHHNLVYFADQRENSKQFTVFMDDADHPCPSTRTEVATVPDFDTFDEAQNALDGLAIKRGFTTERSTPEKAPETEQPDDEQEDLGPDGMEELAEHQELTQTDTGEAPESGNDADETPDSGDDTGDSADEGSDGEQEQETEDPGEPLPEGPDLSLRLPEFDSLFAAADSSLRDLARAMKTKLIESGELAIKVVINNYGGVLKPDPKKCKVDCTPKPAKVSTVIHFPDDLEFSVEKDNRVIVPEDREHQINFDELQPGREISPTGTATVDGKTGIVESYQEDAAEDQAHDDPQGALPEDEEPPEKLYPCENFDCPFYGLPDDGDAGCCYDQDARDTRDPSIKSDVVDAVHFYRCTRPEVIQAFAETHPDEDTDFEGDPDTQEDQPPYSDGEEINQEDDAS